MLIVSYFLLLAKTEAANQQTSLWPVTSIDTMKYSRDPSRDPNIKKVIPPMVAEVAKLGPNHISIATPYDEEFYPVLKAWVTEARKNHLKVWFRGNFSSWEGWFGYPRFTDVNQHHILTKAFIEKHPDLFEDGDIFTPVPEAENGAMGDPRGSDQKTAQFNQFLIDSYNNCQEAFKTIHKNVQCGYFSTNGDIARQVLTDDTVKKIGNIVAIDHYVGSPEQMVQDIDFLTQKFPGAKIVLGEFGAPIPDINGPMTQQQQADFIDKLLQKLYEKRDQVIGLNYWVLSGGSTTILNQDGSERQVANVIRKYFTPPIITGFVKNEHNDGIANAQIIVNDREETMTDKNGLFRFSTIKNQPITITVKYKGYQPSTHSLTPTSDTHIKDIHLSSMTKQNQSFFYRIKLFINNLFNSIK